MGSDMPPQEYLSTADSGPTRERHRGKVSTFDHRHRALIQQARLGRICDMVLQYAMISRARIPLVGVRDSLFFAVRGVELCVRLEELSVCACDWG